MRRVAEFGSVFAAGGIIYALLEIICRGYTHWTMAVVGGIAVLCLYFISAMHDPLWKKWLLGAMVILTIEFLAGILLNIVLRWRVWDYSAYRYHLYGQICLPFAFCWLMLCIPGNALCTLLRRRVFKHREPEKQGTQQSRRDARWRQDVR